MKMNSRMTEIYTIELEYFRIRASKSVDYNLMKQTWSVMLICIAL